ncbi:MAG: phage tail spike protein [Acutalibacteraceae bacterium]
MIPVLYDKSEKDFSHNGIGFLTDTIKATVTEERNGSYELSFQYPVTGQWYNKITDGSIIKTKANETSDLQLFRIYKSSKPLKGIVTYSAEHISYDLNGLPTTGLVIKSATPQMAITQALESSPLEHSFTAVSDISTLNSTSILTPCSVRAILGGQEGSVLDVWGGEYEFDNFVIKLHAHRGTNNGVSIEYGKNLTDIKQESNIADCYTHLMPYAVYNKDDGSGEAKEVYVYLFEKVIALTAAENIGHYKAYIMDFSDHFGDDEIPTEEALRAKATAYAAAADLSTPKVNITVSFVQLWQTKEYKNIAPLERVNLCDTVTVRFSKLGITATAKVIKTVYDSLKEKYDSIELGDAKSSFADTANKTKSDIANIRHTIKTGEAKAAEELKRAISNATNLITGNSGGNVVLHPSEKPQEILILDKPNIDEAIKVWRWNSGGLGYSSTGYNGNFRLAMTMNGAIVADFITAGTLNGALLKADSVQASAISASYKEAVTDEIEGSKKTVEQEFKAADEEVISTINETLKSYSTTTEIQSSIQQTATEITSSVSETLKNYATTEETQSRITQTSDAIMLEVNKKVNDSDFGTKITQNYSSVQIAWNSISNYIKFENSQFNIYNSANIKLMSLNSTGQKIYDSSGALLMSLNNKGQKFYYNGTQVGAIGTNNYTGNDSYKGLAFDLEYSAAYMTWAWRTSDTAADYSMKLTYAAKKLGDYSSDCLHAGCDLNLHNYYMSNVILKDWGFYKGSINGTFSGYYVTSFNSDGTAASWKSFTLVFNNGILQSAAW